MVMEMKETVLPETNHVSGNVLYQQEGKMIDIKIVYSKNEEALEEKRIMEKMLQRQNEENAVLPKDEVDEEEEEESENKTDLEEDMIGGIQMVKSVFVPKSERDTIAECKRFMAEKQHAL